VEDHEIILYGSCGDCAGEVMQTTAH
jgi:hypothetical protein